MVIYLLSQNIFMFRYVKTLSSPFVAIVRLFFLL